MKRLADRAGRTSQDRRSPELAPSSRPFLTISLTDLGRLPILETMAEPVRKLPLAESGEPERGFPEGEPSGQSILQRWAARPDGRLELVELPLTPELFLDPQLGDKMVQGWLHIRTVLDLFELLTRHFRSERDVIVLSDVQHLLGPGLPSPAPDLSVIRGARRASPDLQSFSLAEQGVAPCLVIEVISPIDPRIRRTDEVDKVALYQRVRIQEYMLVDLPRPATRHRFEIKGHRLSAKGRYRPIDPDHQGGLLSETTGLRFGVSPEGDQIDIFELKSGKRLLRPAEGEEALKEAEQEVERLRAEIERLKSKG
jgi:Uma2 family endonuclease